MAKKIIKVTPKYLEAIGLSDMEEKLKDSCVKRIYYDSEISEVLPHDLNQYSVGIASTIDIDADGDVIIPRGIDMSRYQKNPVVLFQHDMNYPIGYAEEIIVNDDKIIAKTRFGTTPEAQRIHQLIKDKVLRTHSIGFIPTEWYSKGERGFNELVSELKSIHSNKFDDTNKHKIKRIVTKALLVEMSVVTVPANEEAVISEIKLLKNIEEPKEPKEHETIEEIEEKAPEIRIVKRNTKIRKVSSMREKELELLKKLYRSQWGC